MAAPAVAFYAPMKAPDHPTPSGDRQIARLTLAALARAGFAPRPVSRLRLLDLRGCAEAQARLAAEAEAEAARLVNTLRPAPALWFTYHCHYKAPDLLGPAVSRALGIPYALSEPSVSPRRRDGPWAAFARASEAAVTAADRLFWTTARDSPGLEAAGHGAKMVHLPAFLDEGPAPVPRAAGDPSRLLTVAMMRPGDKLESYRRLAAGLAHLATGGWRLDVAGDGEAAGEVRALLAPFGDRVEYLGRIDDAAALRAACEAADLMVWPGVNEGVGMAWLEAQAAGLPVIAEDHPAARDIVEGPLAPIGDAAAFACAIEAALADRANRSAAARARVEARHGLDAAAGILRRELMGLIR